MVLIIYVVRPGLVNVAPIKSGLVDNAFVLEVYWSTVGLAGFHSSLWRPSSSSPSSSSRMSPECSMLKKHPQANTSKISSKRGSRSRPVPLSADKRMPSMYPPGVGAAPSFLDYDYAVSTLFAVPLRRQWHEVRGAELNQRAIMSDNMVFTVE